MKVIDLLNKIANGEEVPKKIKLGDFVLEWDERGYHDYKFLGSGNHLLFQGFATSFLSDEIEIIEEDKKIEKYDTGLTNGRYTEDSIKTGLDSDTTIENIIINMGIEITLVKEKMFEIIDYINKENKE